MNYQQKKYECIIFDCDGVLVDSEVLAIRTLVDLANAQGAEIDLNYALIDFKGSYLAACFRKIEEISGKPLPPDFEVQFRKRSFDVFKKELQPVKGIKRVLETLQIPFCTASSGPQEKIRVNLATTGLIHFFEGRIFSCYDIGKWKPDPAIFLHASEVMGFAPKDCLVIEDSIPGVQAAKAGGFDVFGFAEGNENDGFGGDATKIFHSMSGLMSLIDQ